MGHEAQVGSNNETKWNFSSWYETKWHFSSQKYAKLCNNVANFRTNDYRKNSSNSVRGQARSYSYQIQGQFKRGQSMTNNFEKGQSGKYHLRNCSFS